MLMLCNPISSSSSNCFASISSSKHWTIVCHAFKYKWLYTCFFPSDSDSQRYLLFSCGDLVVFCVILVVFLLIFSLLSSISHTDMLFPMWSRNFHSPLFNSTLLFCFWMLSCLLEFIYFYLTITFFRIVATVYRLHLLAQTEKESNVSVHVSVCVCV